MSEDNTQPTTRNHVLGAAEVAAGTALLVMPIVFIAAAGAGFCYLTYKKYQDNATLPENKQKSFAQQLLGAAATAFGTVVSSYTGIGAAIMVSVGLVQGAMGNAASFDMVHGAILGTALQVGIPVIAGAMILEGSYKAITGKDCDIVKSTATYIGKGIKKVTDYVVGTRDKESTKEVTTNTLEDAEKATLSTANNVKTKAAEIAIQHPSLFAKVASFAYSVTHPTSITPKIPKSEEPTRQK